MSDTPLVPSDGDTAEYSSEFERIAREKAGLPPKEEAPNEPEDRLDPEPKEDAAGLSEAPAGDAAPPGTEAAEKPAAEETPDDLWANADPRLREAYEATRAELDQQKHLVRSLNGRASQAQAEVNTLRSQLSSKLDKAGVDNPTGESTKEIDDQGLKELREEYPQFAPLIDRLTKAESEVSTLQGAESARATQQSQAYLDEQVRLLSEAHPDWQTQIVTQEFADWKSRQPLYVQQAIDRSVDGKDTADILTRFKAETVQEPAPKADPKAEPEPQVAARRERQLEGGRGVRANAPAVTGQQPNDFTSAFKQRVAQRQATA